MAEQFILPNATSAMVKLFLQNVKCSVTDLQHANVGWNVASRAAYKWLMGLSGGAALANRAGLPPHFYIEVGVNADTSKIYNAHDFVRSLSRGANPVLLKALVAGDDEWNQGRKMDSLIKEIKQGNVSICLYHLDGHEVGVAERTKVNNFPKRS